MRARLLSGLFVAALVAGLTSVHVVGQAPAAARANAAGGAYTPPRTTDGQPDIAGVYSTATYTPFERPKQFEGREYFSADEAAAYAKARLDDLHDQPQDTHYEDAIWMSEKAPRGMTSLRTSIITDPKNGRLPPMTPEGQKRQAERNAARKQMFPDTLASAQARGLSERCIIWQHEGPPTVPTGYNSNLQIVQGQGVVVLMNEMMRDPRVIPLDGRPALSRALSSLRGDSRGRWDGNTLVIETTNFSDKTAFRGASVNQRVIERLTPVDRQTVLYQFTVDDPSTWTQPWSGEFPLTRTDEVLHEYACHEGNYGIRNILSAQRALERQQAGSR